MTKKTKNKRKTLIKKIDTIFSQYIRLKYSDKDWICLCVSCDAEKYRKDMHNAHFISRWRHNTRRDEDNCRPACAKCNSFSPEMHMRNFTVYQMDRLGRHEFDKLTARGEEDKSWKISEMEELLEFYRLSVDALIKNYPTKIRNDA